MVDHTTRNEIQPVYLATRMLLRRVAGRLGLWKTLFGGMSGEVRTRWEEKGRRAEGKRRREDQRRGMSALTR